MSRIFRVLDYAMNEISAVLGDQEVTFQAAMSPDLYAELCASLGSSDSMTTMHGTAHECDVYLDRHRAALCTEDECISGFSIGFRFKKKEQA